MTEPVYVRMAEATVGRFWIDQDGDVWQLIQYTDRPTAALSRVKDGKRVSGVVGAPIFGPFRPLIEAEQA